MTTHLGHLVEPLWSEVDGAPCGVVGTGDVADALVAAMDDHDHRRIDDPGSLAAAAVLQRLAEAVGARTTRLREVSDDLADEREWERGCWSADGDVGPDVPAVVWDAAKFDDATWDAWLALQPDEDD